MTGRAPPLDALVVGGGFYGAAIATYLVRRRGLRSVALVEREPGLLRRASFVNQARLHSGCHYPRSFTTAYRSRANLPRFVQAYPGVVRRDFVALYAVARRNSQVSVRQFERFAAQIGVALAPAPATLRALFDPSLVEQVYEVDEPVFDAALLADAMRRELDEAGVDVRLGVQVDRIVPATTAVQVQCGGNATFEARYVFNCTYAGLSRVAGPLGGVASGLKHEIAEMALVEPPASLRGVGITVMDGPFFSTLPFPPRGLHTLSHVRYTPHRSWHDAPDVDAYRRLDEHGRVTRAEQMLRDAARYVPALARARYVDSLTEVKVVLVKNEADDGRPILLERHAQDSRCFSVLGGKIDNIFDILEALDAHPLDLR